LAHFENKTAATLGKKETGSQQFVVDPQALCILETLSLQMILTFLDGEDLDGLLSYETGDKKCFLL
jgi:hypothetical protein